MGWTGYDLDGTLAEWGEGTSNPDDVGKIGNPIAAMVRRLKADIDAGKEVRIFTARVGPATDEECRQALAKIAKNIPIELGPLPQVDWLNYQRTLIETWCQEHLGQVLPITCIKDFHLFQLYDDRCTQVLTNTGQTIEDRVRELEAGLLAIAQIAATPPGMETP